MAQSVAIVSVYQTPYKERYDDMMLEELIYQSFQRILREAGLSIQDVDSVVIASSDMTDGRAISCMVTGGPAGSYMKNLLNLSSSGEHAFHLGTMQIMSGLHELTLVASWSKPSEGPMMEAERLCCEPYFTRSIGVNSLIGSSLEASSYLSKHKPDRDAISLVSVKNRKNAVKNPLAHLQEEVHLDAVSESPVVSWPLTALEVPPHSDGVTVMLLASEEAASRFPGPKAWIKGIGWATESYWMGERDLSFLSSIEKAAKQAYKMASITNPLQQLDVAELQEASTFNEIMQYEALGFSERGEGWKLVKDGVVFPDGTLPVNLSGGALSSNPSFGSGLVRIAEVALQVTGKAGERQKPGVTTGIATGVSGFASQNGSVVILSSEK